MSIFKEIALLCPVCSGALAADRDRCSCAICGQSYLIYQGIPDLRHPPAPLDDRDRSMLAVFETAGFEDLFEILLEGAELPDEIIRDTHAYYRNQVQRSENMTGMFLARAAGVFPSPGTHFALDVGCGAGAALVALKKRFQFIAGIDASLAQLLLARKNLEQHQLQNVPLICAYAGALPFPDKSFNYIQAVNVLEHVLELSGPVKEIYRCLAPEGIFAADSRNRFDIFMPEPHTGIRFLGFLPRRRIPEIVRRLRNSQYESTWLFSYGELRSAFKQSFGRNLHVVFPAVSAYGQPAWVDRLVSVLDRIPLIRRLALQLFSSHIVLGFRGDNH